LKPIDFSKSLKIKEKIKWLKNDQINSGAGFIGAGEVFKGLIH